MLARKLGEADFKEFGEGRNRPQSPRLGANRKRSHAGEKSSGSPWKLVRFSKNFGNRVKRLERGRRRRSSCVMRCDEEARRVAWADPYR